MLENVTPDKVPASQGIVVFIDIVFSTGIELAPPSLQGAHVLQRECISLYGYYGTAWELNW